MNPMLVDPEMAEIVDSFIVETKEILENLDVDLMELEKNAGDLDLLNQIFRAFHTIKGTSGFLGLEKLTKVTHRCEDILNKLRKQEIKLNSTIMDAILMSFDKIKSLLVSIENNKSEDIPIEDTVEKLNQLIQSLESGGSGEDVVIKEQPKNPPTKETKKSPKGKKKSKSVEEEIIEENVTIPEVIVPDETEHEDSLEDADDVPVTEEIKQVVASGSTEATKAVQAKKTENTIRVDVQRLDDLLNIVSELVLGRNRLAQVNSEFALENEGTKLSRDLGDATKQIDLMTNELQLVVMKTRMVRIGKVFNRFPRLFRDLSKETKKEIELVIKGEETELDKTLIEEINDPLVHLIRNSVDHGIETPEKRKAAGKSVNGTITLSAEHEGNNIIISVEDDGKGIDPEAIKDKAIAKGLITKEKAKELSRQEALNLIFLPGFSTAEVVTNVSGRGVGMDVVKTNVTKLRGIINIDSVTGSGTKMIIKLPLTLAIIPGMIVKVRGEMVVIPLNSVIEVVRVHSDNINSINQHEVIKLRDSVLPLISIDDLLYNKNAKEDEKIWQYVVVVGIAEKKFGIKVDQLVGQKEVVIKSLGSYLGTIHGIAGSTIMGDGTVVMILDISELINRLAE
ncbi:MAG TPA: chemotaxis protein CheA [Ignavibacteriaceae bacterium]|nr:chemotaxis protein CheA [Ignavibacteriaceae bacterium]